MAAVLAIAVGFLIVDRVLIDTSTTGPESAAAAEPVEEFRVPDVSQLPLQPPTAAYDAEDSLSDRLQEYAARRRLDGSSAGDAFKPPDAWGIGLAPAQKEQDQDPEPGPDKQQEPTFAQTHRLTATFVSGQGGMAIINGQCFNVGQSLDGMRLASVGRDSATLRADGVPRVTLHLAKDVSGGEDE